DQFPISDRPRYAAGSMDDQALARRQLADKLALNFGNIDHHRSLERSRLGNLHGLAVDRGLDMTFDNERVAIGDLDPFELDIGSNGQFAAGDLACARYGRGLTRGAGGC